MLKKLQLFFWPPLLVLLGMQEVGPAVPGADTLAILGQELISGFRHILPDGPDHLAFVAGLFFLARSLPSLLLHSSLFTLAHSLMLGLVVFTGFSLPERWVEAAVGLSIAFLGFEGLLPPRYTIERWRSGMVMVFGCVHGLAFAHSLIRADSLRQDPLAALFGFNLGVELGQLAVIGLLALVFMPWWQTPWYRARISLPVLTLIALSGVHWTLERW